jgi:hypothetical protein
MIHLITSVTIFMKYFKIIFHKYIDNVIFVIYYEIYTENIS